jgi:hypothetical protein
MALASIYKIIKFRGTKVKLFSKVLIFIGALSFCLHTVEAKQNEYTYKILSRKAARSDDPIGMLHQLLSQRVSVEESSKSLDQSTLELINNGGSCSSKEFNQKFLKLCKKLGILSRQSHVRGKQVVDLSLNDEWVCFDLDAQARYLGLDNTTFVSSDEVMDDPFIQIRSESTLTKGYKALAAYPIVSAPFENDVTKRLKRSPPKKPARSCAENTITIANTDAIFYYSAPSFQLVNNSQQPISEMTWQISNDPEFKFVAPSLSQTQEFASVITVPSLAETFFNPDETYYFRVRSSNSKWSASFAFKVQKPDGITDVEFEKLEDDLYEINWERYAEEKNESIDYLVFGSNSLDFIPSIYSNIQINEMINGEVTQQDIVDNLVAVTHDTKIVVPGTLAYYRVIVREKNQLSIPSRLIHVYDLDLVQPRNVLQLSEDESGRQIAKRVLISSTYPWTKTSLPQIVKSKVKKESLFDIDKTISRSKSLPGSYVYNTYVPQEIWEKVRPYFLPENHPAKPKLDRMFSAKRVIQSPETFKKAGFKRFKPGKFSRIMASSHADLKEYFIKAFSDEELRIVSDWMKLIHRIKGAISIRAKIKEHGYEKLLKVPRKWIYPLPMDPSPPKTAKYLRKNFILVAENMRTVSSDQNRTMYKEKVTKPLLEALFTVFYEVGLWDSVFAFNVPFCKDGKLAFIDTEYHHKWPVPFHRMTKYFSREMNDYWLQMAKNVPERPEGK